MLEIMFIFLLPKVLTILLTLAAMFTVCQAFFRREVTLLNALQLQNRLRLYEVQCLMLAESEDVAVVAIHGFGQRGEVNAGIGPFYHRLFPHSLVLALIFLNGIWNWLPGALLFAKKTHPEIFNYLALKLLLGVLRSLCEMDRDPVFSSADFAYPGSLLGGKWKPP